MRRVALAALAVAVCAGPAYAGGDFMDVAAAPRSVWVTGSFGIDELDARTGHTLRRIAVGSLYPLSVAVFGGGAWVAGVEQGYTGGTVTRIDVRTAATRTIFGRQGWAPQQVAVGQDTVWVLFGSRAGFRLGRFGPEGRLLGITRLGRQPGWLAAGGGGALVCCHDLTLLRVDRTGRVHPAVPLPVDSPIWAAAGSIWLADLNVLERIDGRTGRVLARFRLTTHDVAADAGSIYALGDHTLIRIDPRTNRVLARRPIPGITQAVSATATGVWVTSVARPSGSRAFRLDPRTLGVELRLALS